MTRLQSPLKPQLIYVEPLAPAKPPEGAACNGCGLCCLAEPCPLGVVLYRTRNGPCPALCWSSVSKQYRCGAVSAPLGTARGALHVRLQWLAPGVAWVLRRMAARWVAAGTSCDSSLVASSLEIAPVIQRKYPKEDPHD